MKRSRLNLTCKVIALSTTLALTLGVVGCSKASNTTASSDNKPVTLKLITWTNQASVDAIKAVNDKVHAKYPNINVEISSVDMNQYPQLMQTRIAAGDVDIITHQAFVDNPSYTKGLDAPDFRQYIAAGDYLDLTGQPFVKNWDPNAVKDADSVDGKVYGIDIGKVAYNGVFYNKKIFADNGLKVPQTWDEFVTLCKTLQSKGIAPMLAGGKDGWPINMLNDSIVNSVIPNYTDFAKGLWTGDAKFNDATGKKIFERMDQFAGFFEKGVMGVDYASVIGRFVAGKGAMLADGTWQAAQISAADPNFQYGYFAIPQDTAGTQAPQLIGKYDLAFSVFGKSANKDAALKWLEVLSDKDVYTAFVNAVGFIPTMPDVQVKNDFINSLAPINKDFKLGFSVVDYRAPKGVGKYVGGWGFTFNMLKSLGGEADPDKLADLTQNDWDTAMKANAK